MIQYFYSMFLTPMFYFLTFSNYSYSWMISIKQVLDIQTYRVQVGLINYQYNISYGLLFKWTSKTFDYY